MEHLNENMPMMIQELVSRSRTPQSQLAKKLGISSETLRLFYLGQSRRSFEWYTGLLKHIGIDIEKDLTDLHRYGSRKSAIEELSPELKEFKSIYDDLDEAGKEALMGSIRAWRSLASHNQGRLSGGN